MRFWILALLLAILLVHGTAGSALAMSSPNYAVAVRAVSTGGGGRTTSTNYVAHYTVGQTAILTSSGSGLTARLGYWQPADAIHIPYQAR